MPKKNYMYILYLTQLNVINKILMEGEKKKMFSRSAQTA